MKKENIGSSLDDLLADAGILEEVEVVAIKRVLARQVEEARRREGPNQDRHGPQLGNQSDGS